MVPKSRPITPRTPLFLRSSLALPFDREGQVDLGHRRAEPGGDNIAREAPAGERYYLIGERLVRNDRLIGEPDERHGRGAVVITSYSIHYTKLYELASSGGPVQAAIAAAQSATANFGASDEAFAWAFPAMIDSVGSIFAAMLRLPGAGLETQRAAELYASLARDAMLRYSSYNLQPAALVERLADAFADGLQEGRR